MASPWEWERSRRGPPPEPCPQRSRDEILGAAASERKARDGGGAVVRTFLARRLDHEEASNLELFEQAPQCCELRLELRSLSELRRHRCFGSGRASTSPEPGPLASEAERFRTAQKRPARPAAAKGRVFARVSEAILDPNNRQAPLRASRECKSGDGGDGTAPMLLWPEMCCQEALTLPEFVRGCRRFPQNPFCLSVREEMRPARQLGFDGDAVRGAFP